MPVKTLPLLLGGIEGEYGVLAPGLADLGEDGLAAYRLFADLTAAIDEEVASRGGSLKGLYRRGDGLSKQFLTDGGALGFEELNVLEISTPECGSPVAAVSYMDRYEGVFRRALHGAGHLPERTILAAGPACLPHFGPGAGPGYQLGFHLNFNARLMPRAAQELRAVMAALLPLLGCGGLTEAGFRISPLGRMVCKGYAPGRSVLDRLHLLEDGAAVVVDGRGEGEFHRESRLHLSCCDRPFTRRAAAIVFSSYQLLLTLLMYGEDLLDKGRLLNPSLAYSTIADSRYYRRFRLARGGLATVYSLQQALRASLERVRKQYVLTQVQEVALEILLKGMEAFAAGDTDYLSAHFDGHLKEKLYRRVLEDEGVSLSFFDNIAVPIVYCACKLGLYLDELAGMSGRETDGFLSKVKLNERFRNTLFSRLERARMVPADIPALARLLQRMLTLEIGLYRLYPGPSPLAEYEERLWGRAIEAMGGGGLSGGPGRPSRRGELIGSIPAEARRFCLADWSGIFIFPTPQSMGIYSLPSPYTGEARLVWTDGDEVEDLLTDTGLDTVLEIDRCVMWSDLESPAPGGRGTRKALSESQVRRLRDLGTRPNPRQLQLLQPPDAVSGLPGPAANTA